MLLRLQLVHCWERSLLTEVDFHWFPFNRPSGFSARSTAEEVTDGVDGTGLTAVVTGATSGIGTETTRVLTLRGVHVVMAVRNVDAGKDLRKTILEEIPAGKIDVMELDLSSMTSVRKFASDYISLGLPLNILINNAGICGIPFKHSEDGIEMHFATNHIGHFLLTNLLLDTMRRTTSETNKEGRIVNVSSKGHVATYREGIHFDDINDESRYNRVYAYGQSKLANILHSNELARRLKEKGVDITANSLHPGSIPTNILRQYPMFIAVGSFVLGFALKNVYQGAATTCYVALSPQVKGVSGKYFQNSNLSEASPLGMDEELAKKLWDFSTSMTDSKSPEQIAS